MEANSCSVGDTEFEYQYDKKYVDTSTNFSNKCTGTSLRKFKIHTTTTYELQLELEKEAL